MADQNITELPVKTSSGMTSSDYMLGIDSAEGYQMLIKDLGDYIIRNVQVNTIAGANQTLKSALDTLNSKSYQGVTTEYATGLYVYKRGNVGFLKITDPKNLTSNANTTIATIPTGYRPDTAYSFYLPIRNTPTGIGLTIEAGGSVSVYNYSSYTAAVNINETVSYPLA